VVVILQVGIYSICACDNLNNNPIRFQCGSSFRKVMYYFAAETLH